MTRLIPRIWGLLFLILFQCARVVFSITKKTVRGALVAVWNDGRLLLIRKSYRKSWSLPGGMLKKRESWAQAAVRETFEEVGISLKTNQLAFSLEVPGDLGPGDRARIFEVLLESPVDITIDGREIIEAEFVDPKTACKLDISEQTSIYLQTRADCPPDATPPIYGMS